VRRVLICVSIVASDTAGAIAIMRQAAKDGADLVELRLDLMSKPDVDALLVGRPLPVMVTCRPVHAGGGYKGSKEERLALLRRATELGAEYVDAEPDIVPLLRGYGSAQVVASYHDFNGMPEDLPAVHRALVATGADVVKIAVSARRIEDNLPLFSLLRQADVPTIALAMGEAGLLSRVLQGRFGGHLTFTAPNGGQAAAPGQPELSDMLEMYRVHDIGPDTALYGVIANPVGHSLSPAMHNAAFREIGLDAVYLPLLVEEPRSFIQSFVPLGFRGFSVTIPHKQAVMAVLDEVEPLAQRIGAVNTVVVRDGRLCGYNTDVAGALRSIEETLPAGISLDGMNALLIGAGGLGRALAFGLTDAGARLTIANRSFERAQQLAAEVGAEAVPLDRLADLKPDLLLQTTSVGMSPNVGESVVPYEMLRPGLIVYDAVYNPLQTRLLREAEQARCLTISGLGHFVNQGARQFELWTGRPAPREVMRQAVLQRLIHRA